MPQFPTAVQNIVLSLIFAIRGESRMNRTQKEYQEIAARLPPLKQLTHLVNAKLRQRHEDARRDGIALPQLCRFKAGDDYGRIQYEEYPQKVSRETVRQALIVAGMRCPRKRPRKPW